MATGAEGSSDPVAHVLPPGIACGGDGRQRAVAAERHRFRTGRGQVAELSLKDVAAAMLANLGVVGEVVANGVDGPKAGMRSTAPMGRIS